MDTQAQGSEPHLSEAIARRVAEERQACARLSELADRIFDALEALAVQLRADGLPVECRRSEGGGNRRFEMRANGLPSRIVLLTQRGVALLPDHPGAHAALYVFVVTEDAGVGVPVERFLVAADGEIHCDGFCAPAERGQPGAIVSRLIEGIWAGGGQYWAPFDALRPVAAAELEAPHLHGQLGFRPHVTRDRPGGD